MTVNPADRNAINHSGREKLPSKEIPPLLTPTDESVKRVGKENIVPFPEKQLSEPFPRNELQKESSSTLPQILKKISEVAKEYPPLAGESLVAKPSSRTNSVTGTPVRGFSLKEEEEEAATLYGDWKEGFINKSADTTSWWNRAFSFVKKVSTPEINMGSEEIMYKIEGGEDLDLTKPFFLNISGMGVYQQFTVLKENANTADQFQNNSSDSFETVRMEDGETVDISKQFIKDFSRGYTIGGSSFDASEDLKNVVEALRKLGINDEDILPITQLYNQSLFSNPSLYLQAKNKGVFGQHSFKMDLVQDDGKVAAKGSIILVSKPGPDDDDEFKPKYIKVDVFATHLESFSIDLKNVHYYFHPVQDNPPEL